MSTERPSTSQARGALSALALELPSAVYGDVKRIFLPLLDWIDGTTQPPQPRTDLRELPEWGAAKAAVWEMVGALVMYADPESWHATMLVADRPAGVMADDFSEHGSPVYPEGDRRPGARARSVLSKVDLDALDALFGDREAAAEAPVEDGAT